MKQKHNTLCCSWKDRVWTMLKCSAKKQTPCSVCLRSALNSWHEEKSCGTKGSNHVAPAYPPGTWIQLTAERRWSEGGFQPVRVCACVCVCARVCACLRVHVCFRGCVRRSMSFFTYATHDATPHQAVSARCAHTMFSRWRNF